jgi:hypothetical protein
MPALLKGDKMKNTFTRSLKPGQVIKVVAADHIEKLIASRVLESASGRRGCMVQGFDGL